MAISAILIKKRNIFFCKNKYHNAVNHVPNFQLSARSSSFFGALFASLLWSNFFWDTQYPLLYRFWGPSDGFFGFSSVGYLGRGDKFCVGKWDTERSGHGWRRSFAWANKTQGEMATIGRGVLRGHSWIWSRGFYPFPIFAPFTSQKLFSLDISDSRSAICACSFSTCFMVAFCFLLVFYLLFFSQSILPSLSPSIYGSFVGSIRIRWCWQTNTIMLA